MTRYEWLKAFKNCVAKYRDGSRRSSYPGNLMCAEFGFIGKRCMFKHCPKLMGSPKP